MGSGVRGCRQLSATVCMLCSAPDASTPLIRGGIGPGVASLSKRTPNERTPMPLSVLYLLNVLAFISPVIIIPLAVVASRHLINLLASMLA